MNRQLIRLIDLYLQKNLKENKEIKENEFSYAAAKAAIAKKKSFKFGDKSYPVKMSLKKAQDIINEKESNLQEKKKNKLSQYQKDKYGANIKTKRGKTLARGNAAKGDTSKLPKGFWDRREEDEKRERSKPGFKNVPRHDTKVTEIINKENLQQLIQEVYLELLDEKRKKKKKKKKKTKKKSAGGKLSAKTKETLRKKANKRGLTPGSVYREYRKGLAAWGTSGSRKGMSQHQWAHARVNSATPSKPWAVVKKSKRKAKKK